jgi:hypothetical protein
VYLGVYVLFVFQGEARKDDDKVRVGEGEKNRNDVPPSSIKHQVMGKVHAWTGDESQDRFDLEIDPRL